MKGYDFDGVITRGILPKPGDCIITGRTWHEVERTQKEMKKLGIENIPVYYMPPSWKGLPRKEGLIRTGEWKAKMLNELEITEFYEDHPVQKESIEKHWNGTVHHVVNGQVQN